MITKIAYSFITSLDDDIVDDKDTEFVDKSKRYALIGGGGLGALSGAAAGARLGAAVGGGSGIVPGLVIGGGLGGAVGTGLGALNNYFWQQKLDALGNPQTEADYYKALGTTKRQRAREDLQDEAYRSMIDRNMRDSYRDSIYL